MGFFFWLLLLVFLLISSNQWLENVWKTFIKDDYNYRKENCKRGRRVVFMYPFRDEAQFLLVWDILSHLFPINNGEQVTVCIF